MSTPVSARTLQKGSAEMLILALVEERPRHGYEIAQLIEQRSGGEIDFRFPRCIRRSTGWSGAGWSKGGGSKRRASAAGAFTG